MSITKQKFYDACRIECLKQVYANGNWLSKLNDELKKLSEPSLLKLPAVVQQITLLNTLISMVTLGGGIRTVGRQNKLVDLPVPFQMLSFAMEKSLSHVLKRITQNIQNLDTLLADEFVDLKQQLYWALNDYSAHMLDEQPESLFNQMIFPAVYMTGRKRLNDIPDTGFAGDYCKNLFVLSDLFNIHQPQEDGSPSIVDTVKSLYQTMATRVQAVYYALNQPQGLEQSVYVRPELKQLINCIRRYRAQICGSQARSQAIVSRNWVAQETAVLYLSAWYLKVDVGEEVIIRLLNNPQTLAALLNRNINQHLNESVGKLLSDAREAMAWRMTMSMAA